MDLPAHFQRDLVGRYADTLHNPHVPSYATFDARLAWWYKGNLEFSIVGQNIWDNHRPPSLARWRHRRKFRAASLEKPRGGFRAKMKDRTANVEQRIPPSADNGSSWNVWRWLLVFHPALMPAFLVFAFSELSATAQASREYQVKAGFLYNFAQFTQWPTNAFAGAKFPIVIGILGGDPFGEFLDQTIQGETVDGRPLVVRHFRRADEIKTCHILFISRSETRHMDEIVSSLKGKAILTVADADGPSSAGAIIRFLVENNKVHFRVNQEAAAAAGLMLSSKLLRIADAATPEQAP
jgi:hypothetical protein